MKKAQWGILLFSSIILLLFLLGFALPKRILVETELEVNRSNQEILYFLTDLRNWPKWSKINLENDSSLQINYTGATEGIGSVMHWEGDALGKGSMKITNITQMPVLHYVLEPEGAALLFDCKFEIKQELNDVNTHLRWVIVTDLGTNPIMRYAGLILESSLKKDAQVELKKLKEVLEN